MRSQCLRSLFAVVAVLVAAATMVAQPPMPKPGPEMDVLKKQEGTWDASIKMTGADKESKGTMTVKSECRGLWMSSSFEGDFGGLPFQGRGLDSFDQNKKKYVGVWVDSMITAPMQSEGTYDKEKDQLVMVGDSVGPDGKVHKHKMVTKFTDKDHFQFTMSLIDKEGKENLMMTISYTRKK